MNGTLAVPKINVIGGSVRLANNHSLGTTATLVGNVSVTGGTLVGNGMVSGNLNISNAGTLKAGDLANNTTPATLVINGNCAQSGGNFDELLSGTGVQLDDVNVANVRAPT